MVLGLVSSKLPELEPQESLIRRIEDASRYVPLENLALSPQCGFASDDGRQSDDRRRAVEETTARRRHRPQGVEGIKTANRVTFTTLPPRGYSSFAT